MKKFCLLLLLLLNPIYADNKEDYLLCIHGFMGGSWCMYFFAKNLEKDGWDVVNWDYPSRDHTIACHGIKLVKDLKELAEKKPGQPIHFVTHSMGGLVLLSALNRVDCPEEAKKGRVVLIAPPIHGSSWARFMGKWFLARWVCKEFAGKELMTKTSFEEIGNFPLTLESVLVISGDFTFNPILSGINDGTVAFHESCLKSPHQHLVVNSGHKTVIFGKNVCGIVKGFFKKLYCSRLEDLNFDDKILGNGCCVEREKQLLKAVSIERSSQGSKDIEKNSKD